MIYTLKNEHLTVQINSVGAELYSAKRGSVEYVWQGDARYWEERAPMMFPICGRLYEGKYLCNGTVYEMGGHGFLRGRDLTAEQIGETEVRFTLLSNAETMAMYPFSFRLTVVYRLDGDTLHTTYEIANTGDEILPVAAGGHPGFNVPLDGKGTFEDYYLEFSEECSPDEMLLSGVYFSGKKRGMTLENGKILRLKHSLFDEEAVFLSRMAKSVTLKSDQTERFVRVDYPDMYYVGFWQAAKLDAPYVCVEPWYGFPSNDGVTDDIHCRSDMLRIRPNDQKSIGYSVTFG